MNSTDLSEESLGMSSRDQLRSSASAPSLNLVAAVGSQNVLSRLFYRSSIVLALFCFLLAPLAFSTMFTFDSQLYLHQADILFTDAFWRDWDFLRTPLYQCFLKIAMYIAGDSNRALAYTTGLFSISAVLLLGDAMRRQIGYGAAALLVFLLALYPTRIAYGQYILTESVSFFGISLWIWVLCYPFRTLRTRTLATILAALAGYYFRPTFLYLAPYLIIGALVIHSTERRTPLKHLIASGICMASLIVAGAAPWSFLTARSGRTNDIAAFGIVKEGVIPPEHIPQGSVRDIYEARLRENFTKPFDHYDGMPNGQADQLVFALSSVGVSAKLKEVYFEFPRRAFGAAKRTYMAMMGFRSLNSENALFRNALFTPQPGASSVMPGPANLDPSIRSRFAEVPTTTLLGRILTATAPWFDMLMFLGGISCFIVVGWGVLTRKWNVACIVGLPLVWYLFHSLIFMAIDRYSFPAHGVALAALIIVVTELGRWVRDRILSRNYL